MERDTRRSGAPPESSGEKYEPPAVEWEEPFDPVAASTDCCPDPFECPGNVCT